MIRALAASWLSPAWSGMVAGHHWRRSWINYHVS
jgi:hypothetical protein